MFTLKIDQKRLALSLLCEGSSIRAASRVSGISRSTIQRLLLRLGEGSRLLLDQGMRRLECPTVQVDEVWGFVGKKDRHLRPEDDPRELGSFYLFTALCVDSKALVAYRLGKRDFETTRAFLRDLQRRVLAPFQLTTDEYLPYRRSVRAIFGDTIHYGSMTKLYKGSRREGEDRRYSPPHPYVIQKTRIYGDPDPRKINTSHVERSNLQVRMNCRRFTRLTNAFSKKLEPMKAAVDLFMAEYNFCRVHGTTGVTPAQALGITSSAWSHRRLVEEIDPWCRALE